MKRIKIVWCTLWFADYRIPVFKELSAIKNVDFYLVYNKEANSDSINSKVKLALGERAIALEGEMHLGKSTFDGFANKGFRIPYQPGLVKILKDLKPEVLVSDGFFQWTYATLYMRAIEKIPHVMCYERTKHTERNAQKIRTLYRKFALNWIDVICCAGSLCQEYVRYLGFKGPLTEGFMVADVNTFNKNLLIGKSNRSELNSDDRDTVNYLFVGRLIELKGVFQLLKAWKSFIENTKVNAKLTIVGSGDLEDYVIKETLNIDSVSLIGAIPYDEIPIYYINADIFILPTLEDNWSLVVSEAMASELPIITSIYNGCYPELVTKENGWVMDPLDANSFVDVLEKSYASKSDYSEMGKKSLELLARYTPKLAAERVFDSCILALKK